MANTVKQINSSGTIYDIEAGQINPENEYTLKKLNVENKGTSTTAEITFASSSSEGADNEGSVSLNGKGNLAVESLTKHVNIEAASGIQLKPTTNIIVDSGRRIKAGNGNEVHIECKFDDYKPSPKPEFVNKPGNDEPYAELKVEARNIDLRCYTHGGIALQPCGIDGDDFENKIKFESSRTSALGVTPATYSTEGGKGLEFGTFNNEHTSLFTGDYRFNKDGIVYAVTRETPATVNGKTDYPTQEDDFKDVIDSDLGVSWETIVKTAKVFELLSQIDDPNADKLIDCYSTVFHPEV